ncbi:jg18849 [Pararge aegeria aegeria]|uniref:Jg18849 protein n=1 Tax=Pararge aegeria aegeria TaxID=348720 RepID=A0A8S4QNC7_9NEOP|nr:jg18849 [Pararge aegeria aegeria]
MEISQAFDALDVCRVVAVAVHPHPAKTGGAAAHDMDNDPWQRRKMGAYGYYLNRSPASLPSPSTSLQEQALALRRAFSDSSKAVIKESLNLKKRRNSKTVSVFCIFQTLGLCPIFRLYEELLMFE